MGRVALVTGGTRNLGRAAVDAFAAEGADVVIVTSSSPDKAAAIAAEVSEQHGVRASHVVAEISDHAQVQAAVDHAIAEMGHVDIAVEAAAIRPHAPFLEISVEDWQHVLTTNLSSAFFFARALLPGMLERKWGRIIHVSGADGFAGYPNRAHNIAAKAGLHGFTKAVALETAAHGITVNSVVPGAFLTERDLRQYPNWKNEEVAKAIPVQRLGDVEEFAAMCVHLASEKSGYITGQALHMNGGQWMF
jgi:3-oxoacyl-[acyl-carrier protein] reductase